MQALAAIQLDPPERRGGAESVSPVYEAFPSLIESGRNLRAVQVAQEIISSRVAELYIAQVRRRLQEYFGETSKEKQTEENVKRGFMKSIILEKDPWDAIANHEDISLRESDRTLTPADKFRREIAAAFAEFVMEEYEINAEAPQGSPRSALEGSSVNVMVADIQKAIMTKAKSRGLKGHARRIWEDAISPKLINAVTRFKGIRRKAEPEVITLDTLPKVALFWLQHGGEKLLENLKREMEEMETGKRDKHSLDAPVVRKMFGTFMDRFLGGDTLEDVFNNASVREVRNLEADLTIAYEAEGTFDEAIAEKNFQTFMDYLRELSERPELTGKRPNISVKLSALGMFTGNPDDPETYTYPRTEEIKTYLRSMLAEAKRTNAFIRIDMEYFVHKDATFTLFKELLEEDPSNADYLGIVFQTYLEESPLDARTMVQWAEDFHTRTGGGHINLRVVKGANVAKDKEYLVENSEKAQTQNIDIMRYFEQHGEALNLVYGTHNPNTVAHILQTWLNTGSIPNERELQSLLGMNTSLKRGLSGIVQQRVYVPAGFAAKILAYMKRRFDELVKLGGFKNVWFGEKGKAKAYPEKAFPMQEAA